MIELIVTEVMLGVCVAILFAAFVKQCLRIERCEDNMGMSEAEIQELRRRCDAYKELIEALSKSVRELNGVVEEAVKSKGQTSDDKPDTKVLVSGWDADEPEPLQQLISKEEWTQLVKANLSCQRIEPLSQQCILPLPFQQTPAGAILPLWYMNRNLENM